MKRRLVVRLEAQLDADEAAFWYDSRQPGLGDQFTHELDRVLQRLTEHPFHFPKVDLGFRRALLHQFPYAVYFAPQEEQVVVVAVFHQHRHPNAWKRRVRGR
jgi:plasmid stabilization system protein ParE